MRRFLAALFFILLAFSARAQPIGQGPLHSFTIVTSYVGCTGSDYWFSVAGYPIGAGSFPTSTSTIVGVDLAAYGFNDPFDYVMLGKTPPYGDTISPYVYQSKPKDTWWFPAGTGYPFDPTKAGQELHLHYRCVAGDAAWFQLTVTYTVP